MALMKNHGFILLYLVTAVFFIAGCSKNINESKPIFPVQEYEKILLGKITSDYVGNVNCLKGCHDHDKIALDFKASTMGDQLAQASHGMRIVDCESCHGPASELMETIQGFDPKKQQQEIILAHKDNLIDFNTLPSGALSLICLKCHTTNATFNIHNWNSGVHAANDISCSTCHPIHAGADLILSPRALSNRCISCHLDVGAKFSLPSRHPVREGKMYCTDCHDPHGTGNPKQIREITQKEACGRCHAEKVGPFRFEHGDVTEECTTCHDQHGSVNNNLLKTPEAFLCRNCHSAPHISTDVAYIGMYNTRCTDCHSMIHGTDTPSLNPSSANGGSLTR